MKMKEADTEFSQNWLTENMIVAIKIYRRVILLMDTATESLSTKVVTETSESSGIRISLRQLA